MNLPFLAESVIDMFGGVSVFIAFWVALGLTKWFLVKVYGPHTRISESVFFVTFVVGFAVIYFVVSAFFG